MADAEEDGPEDPLGFFDGAPDPTGVHDRIKGIAKRGLDHPEVLAAEEVRQLCYVMLLHYQNFEKFLARSDACR